MVASSAGVCASIITHPYDVLKTRQQLKTSGDANLSLTSIYREGGGRALYRGVELRMATVVPASAIMITVYEAAKRVMATG